MKPTKLAVAGLALALLGLPESPAFAKLKVVTTLQDLASLADLVGGDRVETLALVKGYQDPHFVDAKPSFILKLSRADALIVAGLELEIGYLPPLLDQSRNAKIHPGSPGYLDASTGCEILNRPTQQVTRAFGDVHPYGNPHYWTDPENGRIIARSIAAKLAELDPSGREAYAANLAAFEGRLTEKEEEWAGKMAPDAGTNGHVEPKPGIPPSPTHTLEIINLIMTEKIRLILVEPYFDLKTPKFIAEKTGATVLSFYPSVGGLPEIQDYFALFDYDIDAFVSAMKGKP
ncbi:MAG: hypothetical protein AUI52_06740 [Acidobacteria bacterium 13_1_40CM_2_68_10]|nr:MAG: hypothetical protein AUI52_06740 [Acidobacteria bacterium 13_1_40CM_2_68_10]